MKARQRLSSENGEILTVQLSDYEACLAIDTEKLNSLLATDEMNWSRNLEQAQAKSDSIRENLRALLE